MGCGSSKTSQARPPVVIGGPQNVQIHIPRNRQDEHGVAVQQNTRDIDSQTLRAALEHVSDYVGRQGRRISVIAVGGAVNTLLLRSRGTTHDVDIFGSDFGNQSRVLLDAAMQDAQQHFPGLGTDWLNTETQMWMPGPMHQELTLEARGQNVEVFAGRGLVILAAPWKYALTAKLSRILTGGDQTRPYDLADAAVYLHQYISTHGGQPVPIGRVKAWARHYGREINDNILRNGLNREYRNRYHVDGIVG